MKKKQKQQLLNQFRPSLDAIRGKLFTQMESESIRRYGLPLQITMNPRDRHELLVGLAGKNNEDTRIEVPIDDTFTTVLKRIRSGEEDVFQSVRDNLLTEIVSYWNDKRMDQPAEPVPTLAEEVAETIEAAESAKEETKDVVVEPEPTVETAEVATGDMTLDAFKTAIAEYPKFYVESNADAVIVYEEAAKEPRKLAEISMSQENTFTIEKAMERKYKVKLTFVPLVEAFAATKISNR